VPLRAVSLDSTTKLAVTNGRVLWVDYRGRRALKLAPLAGHERDVDQEMVALLTESDFKDGVIEVDVAGARRSGYSTTEDSTGYKGFIGVSFRVHGDTAAHPALVVNDLRHGESRGRIALWTRISSDAYFSNLRVQSR
jgi:hypothetical protein